MNAIEGRGLTLRYGGFTALDNVDIAVPKGQIRGLIGPNGAGKSTLVDVLSGRKDRWLGEVRLNGDDISRCSLAERRARGLSRSFQRTNIFPDLTVAEHMRVAAVHASKDNRDEVIEQFSLSHLLARRAADISYGDQRRLDLAIALVGRPDVLLLDEPAAGLTLSESLAMAELLRGMAVNWGVTVLLIEHDMEVVFSISQHLTVLALGKIIADGEPAEVRRDPAVVAAYLGTAA